MATAKQRCVQCRNYFLKEEMLYVSAMVNVCSDLCLAAYRARTGRKVEPKRARVLPANTKRRRRPKIREKKNVISQDTRILVKERDQCCKVCSAKGTQVHHVKFLSQGGNSTAQNLVFLCGSCHSEYAHGPKSRYWREVFQTWLYFFYEQDTEYSLHQVRHMMFGGNYDWDAVYSYVASSC